jgi:hypothetical protein
MPSVRQQLADLLKPLLPSNVKIIDVPRSVDGVEAKKPVIIIYRETRAKAPNAIGDYMDTFTLWVISPFVDVRRAEDGLDDLLDEVLLALDTITWLNWSTAERSMFGDQQAPAYKINLSVTVTK